MVKSRKEKRLARKQRAEEQTRSLQTSNEARFEKIYELGKSIIDKKWLDGQGVSRHQGKKEGDVTCIPKSQKTFLRKDLKGHVLDKMAERAASKALGHERVDEFRKSYAYKLVK